MVDRSRADVLRLPVQLFSQWPLTPGQTIGLWEAPDRNHLHLGPVVGIIWDAPHMQSWDSMKELASLARSVHAVPLFFSVFDVDFKQGELRSAACLDADKTWTVRTGPLPDVIYDRGTYGDRDARHAARRRRRRLAYIHDIPFINSVSALDKWDTYLALQFFDDSRDVCPDTDLIADRDSFTSFLNRHRHVFVKDTWSTWGRDVISIESVRSGGFQLKGYVDGRRINTTISRTRELWAWLTDHCDTGHWIVQQAIDRQQLNGRFFDFRIVVQKDGNGKWQVPLVLINWAKKGEVVSNSRRSEFLSDTEFRPYWGKSEHEFTALAQRACDASLLAAQSLEARYGLLGELGIDVAADKSGKAWILEANAKPHFLPGEQQQLPFLYAQHLAKAVWTGKYSGLPLLTENGGPTWHSAHALT